MVRSAKIGFLMDTLANMLSQIKNAQAVGKEVIELPHSQFKEAVARLLEKEGYLREVRTFKSKEKSHKMLSLKLKYFKDEPFITHLKKISKSGQRIYLPADEVPQVLGGRGLVVVSTSRGVMSSKDARSKNLGGEILFEVW